MTTNPSYHGHVPFDEELLAHMTLLEIRSFGCE